MATTLKQIAEILDLDYSTVSYALSGKGSINEATRQRVRETADRLGYIPNGLARRMRSKHSHNIGIVLPDSILNYNEVIQQLYRGAVVRGYETQIALTEFDESAEDRAVRLLLEARMDGIVIRSRYGEWDLVPQGAALRQAAAQNFPIVVYGKSLTGSPFPSLALPLAPRAYQTVNHLFELGHRRIAVLLPIAAVYNHPHESMIEGAYAAYKAAGFDIDGLSIHNLMGEPVANVVSGPDAYGNYLDESLPRQAIARGRTLLRKALRFAPQPTAFVTYNEITAIGASLEASALALSVPGDISIASVTRGLAADLAPLPLTACDVRPHEVANAALDLVIDTIAGKTDASTVRTVDPVLFVGATTGPAR
jgi:LacI family transcriptional regulator